MRREELLSRFRGRGLPVGRAGIVHAWRAARRRPEAVLAAALVLGVLVMIMHWS